MTASQHVFFSGAERGMQQRRRFMENHEKDKIKKIESASSVAKHEQGVTKKDSVADAKRFGATRQALGIATQDLGMLCSSVVVIAVSECIFLAGSCHWAQRFD